MLNPSNWVSFEPPGTIHTAFWSNLIWRSHLSLYGYFSLNHGEFSIRPFTSEKMTPRALSDDVDIIMNEMREPGMRPKNSCGSRRHRVQWHKYARAIAANVDLPTPMPPVNMALPYWEGFFPLGTSPKMSTRIFRTPGRTYLSMFMYSSPRNSGIEAGRSSKPGLSISQRASSAIPHPGIITPPQHRRCRRHRSR